MKKTFSVFLSSYTLIRRDPMLILLLVAPFFAGAALFFGLPLLCSFIIDAFAFDLTPWYPLADLMLLVLTPMMAGMLCGFLMIDERDEGIGQYYNVTPLGGVGYLFSRLILPVAWSIIIAPVLILLFSLSHPRLLTVFAIALTGGLFGAIYTLLLLTFAGNKVEALAVAKILGLTMLPMFIPFFTDSPWSMLAGIFPAYWIGTLMHNPVYILPALIVSTIWMAMLYSRMRRTR